MPPRLLIAAVSGLLLSAPGLAQDAPAAAPKERMSTLIVFGNDPCPRSTSDEIVVCARMPESERYRVPKRFRGKREDAPAPDTWANRVSTLETVSRIGTPNSCSPVGSGGQTGCYSQFLRQSRDERRQAEAEAAAIP
ncbi:MAG: hypothetical protein JWL91_929 [Sphingomonas bacterium]|nr:hypothetical protein [Sphingomonas bacterium]MDB5689053.1 hypothetical protein [Sphingomonas bacterium]